MTRLEMRKFDSTSAAGSMLIQQVRQPVLVGFMLAGLGTSTAHALPPEIVIRPPRPAEQTTAGAVVLLTEPAGQAIGELRRLSGLTWDQLARLFNVSRRSVHFWASGKAMTPSNEEHLHRLLAVMRKVDRGSANANRTALLTVGKDESIPFDLLVAGDYERVASLLGAGPTRGARPAKVSVEVAAARMPRPPHELVGALQDRVHPASGRLLGATAVRVPRSKRVPPLAPDFDHAKRIDAALEQWRQGDLALGESWFVHVGDPAEPLTDAAAQAGESGLQALTSEVAGLVVVTQTCDIVRSCAARPYVEVAPLVLVDADDLVAVQRGRRPSHASLPALAASSLVADLDRVMTVEKSVVARWNRTPGYTDDADGRWFAQALARKRVRFAFPDAFAPFSKKLQARLTDKHEKETDEGRGLRALREIRVQASPAWEAASVTLFFWFVRNDAEANFEGKSWADLLKEWLKLVPPSGPFTAVEGQVVTLDDMSGAEYVASDPLDLDHLSSRTPGP